MHTGVSQSRYAASALKTLDIELAALETLKASLSRGDFGKAMIAR